MTANLPNFLLSEAQRLLAETPSALQVNLLAAAGGSTYSFLRFDLEHNELQEQCLRRLREDRELQVLYIVCMWHDFTIDMPSHSLRKALLALHPANTDARVLLQGETGINVIPLGVTVPNP